MTTREAPSYAPDAILTVKEAADYVKLSQSTIRSLCHIDAGDPDRIPHTRIGNSIRIPYWPLLLWLFQRSGGELPPGALPSPHGAGVSCGRPNLAGLWLRGNPMPKKNRVPGVFKRGEK